MKSKFSKESLMQADAAKELINFIYSHLDDYTNEEQSFLISNKQKLETNETTADILERILFSKFSTDEDSALRIGIIEKILQNNKHISIDDVLYLDFYSTPLMAFTAQGGSRICQKLLQSSVNPNPFVKDNKNKTLLHLLVAKGHQRDDISIFKDYEDQRPLFESVLNHIDIKTHINDQDSYGQTALHYAAARRDFYYINLLLINGSDPNIKDQWGRNMFDVIQLSEQERVNILASALYYSIEWSPSLSFRIYHNNNSSESVGNVDDNIGDLNIGFFCGHISKKIFNQDANLLIEKIQLHQDSNSSLNIAKRLFDTIYSHLDDYTNEEQSFLISNKQKLETQETTADILERILFSKFSTDEDSALRIGIIEKILQNNKHISIDDVLYVEFYSTPLMAFTAQGGSRICQKLLQSSVNPNPFVKDNKNKTLLHLLVAKGNQRDDDCLKSSPNYEDQRPLFESVLNHADISNHINDQDNYGQTALHYAAARRDLYYINLLLMNGADPNVKDQWGRNMFDVIQLSEQDRVNLVASALSLHFGKPSLNFAIQHDSNLLESVGEMTYDYCNLDCFCGYINKATFNQDPVQLISSMKDKSIVINPVVYDNTFLNKVIHQKKFCKAAEQGDISTLLYYTENIHKIVSIDQIIDGFNALMLAVMNHQIEAVIFLLNCGCEINATNANNTSPLLLACSKNYNDIISLLVNKGANLTQKHRQGTTPLSLVKKNFFAVNTLLNAGLDINQTDGNGKKILDNDSLVYLYWQAFNERNPNYISRYIDAISAISQNKAKVMINDGFFRAVEKNQPDLVQFFLEKGADINVSDLNERTPLFCACQNGFNDIVSLLISKEANLEKQSKSGDNPLTIACWNNRIEIVRSLLEAGSEVNAKNADGKTALELANIKSNHEMVELIENYNQASNFFRL